MSYVISKEKSVSFHFHVTNVISIQVRCDSHVLQKIYRVTISKHTHTNSLTSLNPFHAFLFFFLFSLPRVMTACCDGLVYRYFRKCGFLKTWLNSNLICCQDKVTNQNGKCPSALWLATINSSIKPQFSQSV